MNKKVLYRVDGFPWLKAWAVDGDVIVKAQARMTVGQARDLIACLEAAIRDADPVVDVEILEDPEVTASRIAKEHDVSGEYVVGTAFCTCGWARISEVTFPDREHFREWLYQSNRLHAAYVALTEGLAS